VGQEASTRLIRALQGQLDSGVETKVFPGASACVALWQDGRWSYLDAVAGALSEGSDAVTPDTVYDLASLTKPWVAMSALALHHAGVFDLGARVDALVPEAGALPVGGRTWEEVLSHRAGFEAWVPFYEALPEEPGTDEARAWVLRALLSHDVPGQVGTAVYSDLGYILAGMAIARASNAPLDEVVASQRSAPLGVDDVVYFGAAREGDAWKRACAPTGWSPWRRRMLIGEVHDDNCAALGGVAGHAGMFGAARGVAAFGAACVGAWHGRRGASEEAMIQHATAPRARGTHRLGWDGKADEGSAAGSLLDATAFGHLGFTGTSLWCDPRRQLVIVLLTNRVAIPGDNAAIKAFRPTFHDAITQALDGP
jgi:CubicO group peptidase (beta-lactamase class C family)